MDNSRCLPSYVCGGFFTRKYRLTLSGFVLRKHFLNEVFLQMKTGKKAWPYQSELQKMNSITSTEIGEGDSFIVHLIRPEGKDPYVASLELVLPDMRNRYSFKDGRSIDATFVGSVAMEIRNALGSVRVSDRLVSLPDFEIALPNLVLSGLRILVTRAEDGVEYLMLRFRRFVGALKSVFQFDTSMALPTPIMRERIAVEVLHDIVTPLFDIMSLNSRGLDHLMENHTSLLRKRINTIVKRQEEITFYIGMLQRYVAGCKSDQVSHKQITKPERETETSGERLQ